MRVILFLGLAVLAGCGNQARLDYYAAVEAAAAAQAKESEARYAALSNMARGDGDASVAAVMAIALAQKPVIQPQFIEDDALKWAQILAGPVAAVTSLAIQADLSRDLNDSNKDIAIARINADAATDQRMFQAFSTPQAPSISGEQLTTVVDGFVELGTQGLRATESLGFVGIQSTASTGQAGFNALTDMANHSYQTIEQVVADSYMTIEKIGEDCGGCGSCFTCTPPDLVIEPPQCGDGELVVSPGICVPE